MKKTLLIFICWFLAALFAGVDGYAQRITLSLNGTWQIEEGVNPEEIPGAFNHEVPVPGLVKLATPSFPQVDEFYSREYVSRTSGNRTPTDLDTTGIYRKAGVTPQERNYFWYRTSFRASVEKEVALLKVGKAQFGTAVWLNGVEVGEHLGSFTAGYFDLTDAIRWDGENELVVRIGAHPNAVPARVPTGTDIEKIVWTPGIYDEVSVILADNPVIETIQVAPRIDSSEILVQVALKNYNDRPATFSLVHEVHPWKDRQVGARSQPEELTLGPGETRTITDTISIPEARLWSPEDPFLYVVETSTGGDSRSTRFGMREFRFDTPTRRAYLNGKVYFMRGSNITLHRFFEDEDIGTRPWDEEWVRKLLVDIPGTMGWNSFRFCIGPVPDFWLDIADEAGLLIQNEFFIWMYRPEWDIEEVIREYREWMRDNWNHASVVIWDANNETRSDLFAEEIIPAVRDLDLSGRAWENGYNLPEGADDPVEDHPYLYSLGSTGYPDISRMTGYKSTNSAHPTGHASIINEYAWLWLNRDGTPTELTSVLYGHLLGEDATQEERLELQSYLVAAETEYWRAHRNFAGVLHFVYLTSSFPGAFTSDNFKNVKDLQLHEPFEKYVGQAFQPLGVYVNVNPWPREEKRAGSEEMISVVITNDDHEWRRGRIVLALGSDTGNEETTAETAIEIPPLGQKTLRLKVNVPNETGSGWIRATVHPDGLPPTISRRKISIVHPADAN